MNDHPFHPVDLILKKRSGLEHTPEELRFLANGAAKQSIPPEQLSAWLMAAFQHGLTLNEVHALTTAMRYSGEVFDHTGLCRPTVDKHSTGGVGDSTSFLLAPLAASAGLAVPMISGRALGHTGGTLDKLETIPGYNTQLSLAEARRVLDLCGATMIGQTKELVPADHVLYDLRDRTGSVESPWLISASIMSKKLAEGLDGLVLDIKTGSGAFLTDPAASRLLASIMVDIGERSGTRTVALLTSMDQPLGRFAGNWLEIWEAVDLLANRWHPMDEDLRQLSLILAGWMIYLGGKASTPAEGRDIAETNLIDGKALDIFLRMVEAQGGDTRVFDNPEKFHRPKFRREFCASHSGYLARMDCTKIGWAVQRLGAGRERAGEPVNPHAGLEMRAKLGTHVRAGQPLFTLFADDERLFAEPERLLTEAVEIADEPAPVPPLISQIITAENKDQYLEPAARPLG
ncbi:MAG: thymidine phosphorylase [Silvibacterium sp.]|nr:thymidine phosphorylase [Silvibacterium sp.]